MKTKTLFGTLLLTSSLSVYAAGSDLDLGLCDKLSDLTADAPPHSPVPKAKKGSSTAAPGDASAPAPAPAKTAKALLDTSSSRRPQLPPER